MRICHLSATEFHELELPTTEFLDGKLSWCVGAVGFVTFYLVNDNSYTVTNILSNTVRKLRFNTEVNAHQHACEYYTSHGERYPYFAEYKQAIGLANSSHRMTFG